MSGTFDSEIKACRALSDFAENAFVGYGCKEIAKHEEDAKDWYVWLCASYLKVVAGVMESSQELFDENKEEAIKLREEIIRLKQSK